MEWPETYPPFQPRRWVVNGHLQTIFGNFLPRTDALPPPEIQMVEVSPAHGSQISSQVLCECHWQPMPQRRSSVTAIILHGLEGSSHSQYVTGNANKLWRSGCNVIRMNMRNCGPMKYGDMLRLSPTLYHSGLSSDVERVLRFFLETQGLESVALIGYSMGGNLVLKLAGDLGASVPAQLHSVVGVSPAVDLSRRPPMLCTNRRTASTSASSFAPWSSVFGARLRSFHARSIRTVPRTLLPSASSMSGLLRSIVDSVRRMIITRVPALPACWIASPFLR